MLMVAEMTGNLSLLAPAMIAVSIASIITGKDTIYASQVNTRADSPAHRLQLSFPLLSTLAVRQALLPLKLIFSPEQSVAAAERALVDGIESGAPVLSQEGSLLGVVTQEDIQRVPLEERERKELLAVMNREPLTILPDTTLDEALEQLTSNRVNWAPVVEPATLTMRQKVMGVITAASIARLYRKTSVKDSRRMRGLVEGTVMVEAEVGIGSRLDNLSLRDAHLPAGSLVVSIRRQGELIFPRGSSVMHTGDTVTFLVSPQGEELLQQFLAQRPEQDRQEVEDAVRSTPAS
jgi:CIC family chloride channel protein